MIIFDIGAYDGNSCFHFTNDPNNIVYAFEAEPAKYEDIKNKFGHVPNYHIYPYAITEIDGLVKFNVCKDPGCSSLHEFSDDVSKTWKVNDPAWNWKMFPELETYRYFFYTDSVEVSGVRLDTFCNENNITTIDYLHIDTQGHDLSVLKSLGEKIVIVNSGLVEVPFSEKVLLYKNQPTKEEMIQFLVENKFKIDEIYNNDALELEINIRFSKI